MTRKRVWTLNRVQDGAWQWLNGKGAVEKPFSSGKTELRAVAAEADLCLCGDDVADLVLKDLLGAVLPYIKVGAVSFPFEIDCFVFRSQVFARMAPEHKALVVGGYNSLGLITLMCGDGTNDVGALKRAHVGVAIMTTTAGAAAAPSSSSIPKTKGSVAIAGGASAAKTLEKAMEEEAS
jgi:cation-transporting ATPase 13A1